MDGWMDGKDGGEDVFVLCAPGREWTLCGNGDRPWRTAVFVHPPICLLAVCVNSADVCFLPPQARRWRGCTGWQGRTWHRWRLWCSAWARPPSPSSSPSHASSPPCEGGQKKNPGWAEGQTLRANETVELITAGFVEGRGGGNCSGPLRLDAGESAPRCLCSVTATITLQSRGNWMQTGLSLCRRAAPGGDGAILSLWARKPCLRVFPE